jgi:hypothetical protein
MYIRTTKFNGVTPDRMNSQIGLIADSLLPKLETEWGLVDGYIMANHAAGQVMGVTVWDSEPAMRRSGKAEREMADKVGVDWRSQPVVDTWEVVLSHKDVLQRGAEVVAAEVRDRVKV